MAIILTMKPSRKQNLSKEKKYENGSNRLNVMAEHPLEKINVSSYCITFPFLKYVKKNCFN